MIKTIAVFGAGSWGTALALHLARKNHRVLLWHNVEKEAKHIQKSRMNERYLPGISFPDTIRCLTDLAEAIFLADVLLVAVPSHAFRGVIEQIKPLLKKNQPLIWASKGLDSNTHQLLHEIVLEHLTEHNPIAVLSGPNFAVEVANGLPAATTIACTSKSDLLMLCDLFKNERLRVYGTDDIVGVEVAGAVKNVIAIAVGICDGLDFGSNARAALITRGLAEITRLAIALGAKSETLMDLAGVGDLLLTCTDDKSRNRRFGLMLGQGIAPTLALEKIGQVVEGYANVHHVLALAEQHHINMPITEQVYKICYQNLDPRESATHLMQR